jgi:F420-0:gamma-glutamyl ligase-like protein
LKKEFSKRFNSEEVVNIVADVDAGYSKKEEVYNCLKSSYDNVMTVFKDEFGFRPYRAGELKKNAWIES